jgi:lipoyl(octanoyl) transferase
MQFEVISLPGARSFTEVRALQLELLQKRIDNEISDTLIFCEHTPVVTRGRGLQKKPGESESPRAKPFLPSSASEYLEIERGGDLTYHGPGQLVLYPIVKLGGEGSIGKFVGQDVDHWIRFLENIWIDTLSKFSITATSKAGGSGVWISESPASLENKSAQKKVASVGIALRRWVNYHGIALNVVNDLSPFFQFDPCGFNPEVMTNLKSQPSIPADLFNLDWRNHWEKLGIEAIERLTDRKSSAKHHS